MTTRLTLNQYIQKAKAIHGDRYDYNKTTYVNSESPVTITCLRHGDFKFGEAKTHTVRKRGCPKCEHMSRFIDVELSDELKKKYTIIGEGIKYKFLTISCPKHSHWNTDLSSLTLKKKGLEKDYCKYCRDEKRPKRIKPVKEKVRYIPKSRKTTDQFIKDSVNKWGKGAYEYDVTEYINNKKSLKVRCYECKYIINVSKPYRHLQDDFKCYNCKKIKQQKQAYKTFIKKADEKYKSKFDYSLVDTSNFKLTTKVKIICPTHGQFEQTPIQQLKTTFGCQQCGAEASCGYSRSDYINKCNGREPILYLVHFELDGEEFYKIGITVNSISRRFRGYRSPYNHTLIDSIKGEAGFIFDLEKKVQKDLVEYKYKPKLHMERRYRVFYQK